MPRITDAPFRTPEGGVLLWSLIREYLRAFTGVKISPGRQLCKLSYGKHPLSIKITPPNHLAERTFPGKYIRLVYTVC